MWFSDSTIASPGWLAIQRHASALFAARVYSATDRKLKTLESLIQLVKRA